MFYHFVTSLGIWSIIFWLIMIILLSIPYSYILTRFISKAWHKSKQEEKKYE